MNILGTNNKWKAWQNIEIKISVLKKARYVTTIGLRKFEDIKAATV
jgi:hypothetical protein